MKIYNKLVRDKIPEIIAKQGKTVTFRSLQGDELKEAAINKLFEEAAELLNAETEEQIIEEIADTLEVLYAIQDILGITDSELFNKKAQKYTDKGGFTNGYFLESVVDNTTEETP